MTLAQHYKRLTPKKSSKQRVWQVELEFVDSPGLGDLLLPRTELRWILRTMDLSVGLQMRIVLIKEKVVENDHS